MCLYPNRVFYTGRLTENGKKETIFTSRFTNYMYRHYGDERWLPGSDGSAAETRAIGYQVLDKYDDVPCGQCIECRINYARMWSCRIMNETELYPPNTCWFVTCTYNEDHLPPAKPIRRVNKETGEITIEPSRFNSLNLRDHQLFMKRLRKYMSGKSDMKVKFFMSGEYGEESLRPHFHYILFGVYLNDLELYKITPAGDRLYTSRCLQELWNNGPEERGFVTVGAVTPDSAGYISRYAIKKRKKVDTSFYEDMGLKPEFLCMSRKPGIGKEWFDLHKDEIYETDKIVLSGRDGAISVKPPRYYDNLFSLENMDQLELIKENRKYLAEAAQNTFEHLHPFLDHEAVAEAKERNYNKTISMLKSRNVGGD